MEKVLEEISGYSDFELNMYCLEYKDSVRALEEYILPSESLYSSSKMLELSVLLPQLIEDGHRILLFSQWTSLLDIFTVLLDDLNLTFLRLDGQTSVAERQGLIEKFAADKSCSIFLLSTRAGGLGINLAAADTVILHDVDC